MNYTEQINHIQEIRSLMERSGRYLSLSGLSGIFSGIVAVVGTIAAYYILKQSDLFWLSFDGNIILQLSGKTSMLLLINALSVFFLSLIFVIVFTRKKAKQKALPVWDQTSRLMMINLLIPLIFGGLFCLILVYHGLWLFTPAATHLFFGLALINGSKYTLKEIKLLGILHMIAGIASGFLLQYSLLIWGIGFGLLHIIYGFLMYHKYDRS